MVTVLLDAMFDLEEDQKQAFVDMQAAIGRSKVQTGVGFAPDFLEAFERVRATINALVAERRAHPADDFISHLVVARDEGDALTDIELFDQVFSVCAAALQSTATSMGGVLYTLCRHPGQFAELRANSALVPSAIEECLRLQGPGFLGFAKFALVDTEIGDTPVLRGMPVLVATLGANLDPEQYPDPLRFDIHRDPKNIQTFGSGVHLCLGFRLARLVLQIGLTRIMERFARLRLADPDFVPVYRGQFSEITPTSLPLRVR
jgi:cytochrome P450